MTLGRRLLLPVRSASLDSIATVLSIEQRPSSVLSSRASSMDNLTSTPHQPKRKHTGGKTYMILDNESVGSENGCVSPLHKQSLSRSKSDPVKTKSVEYDGSSDEREHAQTAHNVSYLTQNYILKI